MLKFFLLCTLSISSLLPAHFSDLHNIPVEPFFERGTSYILQAIGNQSEIVIELIGKTKDKQQRKMLKTILLVELTKAEKIFQREIKYLRDEPSKCGYWDIGREPAVQQYLKEIQRAKKLTHCNR
jgi:hypothetical protein